MSYVPQPWVDDATPVDAAHMKHIEDGLAATASVVTGGVLPAAAAGDEKTVTTMSLPGPTYGVKQLVTVMVYHSVPSLATFQADLDFYQEWNYTTITPDDLYNYLIGNRASLPTKPLLITFDDGLLTQFTIAYPELLARGMTATFYVIPNWMDDIITGASFGALEANHFTWANAVTMFANRMRIQSHTMNHVSLLTLTDVQVVNDFAAAKARIEAMVPGETVSHEAYPYGLCAATAQAALAAAGLCKTGRTVTNNYAVASSGRNEYVSPFTPRLAVPTAGALALDTRQANVFGRLEREPQLVPDWGFKSGAAKGWTLATGASVDAVVRPGAPAGTKPLKQVQQVGSVSSSWTRYKPIGTDARIRGSVWIKTAGLGAVGRAFIFLILLRPDALTTYATSNFATAVPDNQDWTQYVFDYYGDTNVAFVRMGLQVTGGPGGTAWFAEPSLDHFVVPAPGFALGF